MKTKNKEIINFLKGNKIANQVIELIRGKNCEDKESLDEFIAHNRYADNLIENLTNIDRINELRNRNAKSQKYDSLRSAERKMEKRMLMKRRRRIFIYSLSSSATAAVIVLSFFVFKQPSVEKNYSTLETQTNANVFVPTLVLGSGDNINLEKEVAIKGVEIVGENKLSYFHSQTGTPEKIEYNRVIIPNRYSYTVVLSDSTEVMLNAGSELRYPTKFSDSKREVFLKGEGFFNVKKGNRPFIVTTSDVSVRVYGTVFNINTNHKNGVETLLISGSVGVTVKNEETMIKPSQLFTLNKMNGSKRVETVNVDHYIAWTHNLFQCDNGKLSTMLEQMSEWYGVEFEYLNDKVGDVKIDIKISRKSELKDIVKALEKISGAVITQKNENVYVIK